MEKSGLREHTGPDKETTMNGLSITIKHGKKRKGWLKKRTERNLHLEAKIRAIRIQ